MRPASLSLHGGKMTALFSRPWRRRSHRGEAWR